MTKIDSVLFDLGDTLVYFDGDYGEASAQSDREMQAWMEDAGYRLPEGFAELFNGRVRAFLAKSDTDFIEITAEYFLRSLLAEAGYATVPDADVRAALDIKFAATQPFWKLEEDTLPVLERLKVAGYRLGLVSNSADKKNVEIILKRLGLEGYFDVVLISAEAGVRKPNPKIFHMALDAMHTSPDRTVMVGDTLGADILGAKSAGIKAIYLTRRAKRPDNRAHEDTIQPDAVIGKLSDVMEILQKLNYA